MAKADYAPPTGTMTCPVDGGFINEFRADFSRGLCPKCGAELIFRSRAERRRDSGRPDGIERPESGAPRLQVT